MDIKTHKVLSVNLLSGQTIILKLERKNIQFIPGQHIVVSTTEKLDFRQYSIFSSINNNYIELIIKIVQNGVVTNKLLNIKPGHKLFVDGPFGSFTLNQQLIKHNHIVFIATGTGIAPFNSMVISYKNFNYSVIHGITSVKNAGYIQNLNFKNYTICTSSDNSGHFNGRVTDYIKTKNFNTDTIFYFCGNGNMIFDAMQILKQKGISANQMFAEVFY